MSARKAPHHGRRIGAIGLAALTGLAMQLALVARSAEAFVGYTNAPSAMFGASGAGNGQFSSPLGVAVEDSSGDVYVVDQGNNRIEKFDAAGKYLSQISGAETPAGSFSQPRNVAVDNSAGPAKGDVYVTDVGHGVIDVFSSAGKYLSQVSGTPTPFGDGTLYGVAVDGAGNVWAYESNGNVDEFSNTGSFLQQFNTGRGTAAGFAVDTSSNVYVLFGCDCVGKYTPTGTKLAEWGSGIALAVNEQTNNVFLDTASSIEEFGAFGEPYGVVADAFGSGSVSAGSVGVNDATGTVYVSDSESNTISVFKSVLLPDVTTGEASEVTRTSAKLEGVVNPDGQAVTSCELEYGPSTAYGQSAPCTPAPGAGSSPVAVSASLSGLTPGVTYHYRVVAGNANGLHEGADATVATPDAVEGVQSEAATNVEKSAGTIVATLNGTLEPNGLDAHYYFEYGETTAYGSVSPALPGTDAGEASKPEHAQTQLTGLKAATRYHFRLVATNSFGATEGKDTTFTTPSAVEGVLTGPAEEIRSASATFLGLVEPNGFDTHYVFEYGLCTNGCGSSPYDKVTVSQDAGSASEAVLASAAVSGLEPNASYHFRIIAENVFGVTAGEEERFTTAAAVATIGAQRLPSTTRVAATLGWMLNPENSETTYRVLYGTTSAYGEHTESGKQSGLGEQEVVLGLSGLAPETTYHYALQATNQAGTVTGPDETLTTGPASPPTATTGGASELALTSATVSGTIDPDGLETSYEIDFGTDASYGTSIYGDAGAGTEGVPISALLQNLAPGTTYHYRIVAINSDGRVYGADRTFTTPVYSNPIVLPSTLPLIGTPAVAFPTETEPTQKAKKKTTGRKGKKHRHQRKAHHKSRRKGGHGRKK